MLYKQLVYQHQGNLRSAVILLMGDNEMALLSIEWVYRVKECKPARSV